MVENPNVFELEGIVLGLPLLEGAKKRVWNYELLVPFIL